MRLLIVDDDAASRTVVRALLKQHVQAQLIEAQDGAEALDLIQSQSPDVVFLDLKMPVMDGIEVLETLRADSSYQALPVIVMSAAGDTAMVQRAISLGISDYLVKPLRPLTVDKRIPNVLAAIEKRRSRGKLRPAPMRSAKRDAEGGRRILIVDGDVNFRTFFVGLYDQEHEIVEAQNGTEAARSLARWTPDIACLGAGLKLPTERVLARKLRMMDPDHPVAVFLCTEKATVSDEEAADFDGVLHKTFVVAAFRKEFAEVALGRGNSPQYVFGLINDRIRDDVVTAMRQTLGVTTMQETRMLEPGEAAKIVTDIWATVELTGTPETLSITVAIAGSRADIEHLAERMVGGPMTFEEGAGDAFGELVNTVGGRVEATLEAQGVPLKIGLPVVAATSVPADPERWRIMMPFETEGGERVLLAIGAPHAAPGGAA
jgi:CheY-like chemotaxis protein